MNQYTGTAVQLEKMGFKRIAGSRLYELNGTTVNMFTGEIKGSLPNQMQRLKLVKKVRK